MDKDQFKNELTDEDQVLLERGSRFAAAGELDAFIKEVLGVEPKPSGQPE